MSRPLVTFPRADVLVIDYLDDLLVEPVSAKLPPNWTGGSPTVLTVSIDGTPIVDPPFTISPTIRLVAWAAGPTDAHELVMLAAGHLEAHDGELFTARLLNGPIPATDPDHEDAALCAATLRVRVRSQPASS